MQDHRLDAWAGGHMSGAAGDDVSMASEAALPLRGQERGRAGINADLGLPAKKRMVGKTPARGRALNLTPERFAEKSRPNDLFFAPMPLRSARHSDFANPPP
jgi:hypothetical protein